MAAAIALLNISAVDTSVCKSALTRIGPHRLKGLLRAMEDELLDIRNHFRRPYPQEVPAAWHPSVDIGDVDVLDMNLDVPAPLVIDYFENDSQYTVMADVPGLQIEDLQITMRPDNVLTIQAERKHDDDAHHMEREFGSFERNIKLPLDVDPERITAHVRHGELIVSIPKTQQPHPQDRVIDVL